MAIKKIRMRPESTNDYADVLHPETSIDNIVGLGSFGTATGTDSYSVTIPNFPALITGYRITVKFPTANTGNSSLNVNGLGAKNITKAEGVHIPAGTIKANGIYTLVYGGSYFHLQGEGGVYGNALANQVLTGRTFGTDNGLLTGTMENRGAPTQTLTTQGGQYNIPAGYYSGGSVKAQFANLFAGNIKSGVNIGGVVGTQVDTIVDLIESGISGGGTMTKRSSNVVRTIQPYVPLSIFNNLNPRNVILATIEPLPGYSTIYDRPEDSPGHVRFYDMSGSATISHTHKNLFLYSSIGGSLLHLIGLSTYVSIRLEKSVRYTDSNFSLYNNYETAVPLHCKVTVYNI